MKRSRPSTRRTFIQAAGAALSVPVVAAAQTSAHPPAPREPLETRLARLEDCEAIRALNREFGRRLNAGDRAGLGELYVDPSGIEIDFALHAITTAEYDAQHTIEIGPDRQRAAASLQCAVEFEEDIGPSCTVVEMARLQGGGTIRRTERGILEHTYVRNGGVWRIQRSVYQRVARLNAR